MSGDGPEQPELRLSDDDREQAVAQLRRHFADGRLTLDEFADRTGMAYAARTSADLGPVLDDLPAVLPTPTRPEPQPAPDARTRRQRLIAVMSGSRRRGRWKVDRPITAFAFWGGVEIDLRNAEIVGSTVEITAWAIMGGVEVVVPEGIPVDVDGFILMGGHHDATRNTPALPGAPTVVVRCRGMWGGVHVRNPSRRGNRQEVIERSLRHAERHAERLAERSQRHAERLAERFGHDLHPPAPPVPPSLPTPSLDDLIPTIPEPARSVLRDLGWAARSRADERGAASAAGDDPTSAPRGTVTVLFTDIEASTEVAESLGDQRWMDVLRSHNELIRRCIARHDGTEVKVHGDGLMVAFQSARSAVLAAIDVQRALETERVSGSGPSIDVRIGIHTGEVVDADGDYFGRNVILAARLTGHAKGGEIVVSGLVKDLTDSSGDLVFDDGEDVTLKGLARPWRVHRVEWV